MCALKAAGLSFNFSNVIQVVMSVSRCMLRLTFGGLILYSCHQHASHLVYQMAANLIEKCLSWLAKFYKEIPFPHYTGLFTLWCNTGF